MEEQWVACTLRRVHTVGSYLRILQQRIELMALRQPCPPSFVSARSDRASG